MYPSVPKHCCSKLLNRGGLITEGLMAALFVGLVLFVVLFSYFSSFATLAAYLQWFYAGMAAVITVAMLITYLVVASYRKRRFQKGGRDDLMMRNLMVACLDKDCSAIEQQIATANGSDLSIFNQMLLCKLQNILEWEGAQVSDIRTRFRESGIKRIKGVNYENFFNGYEFYDMTPLPFEIKTIALSLKRFGNRMNASLTRLKTSRRLLFTFMRDYLDLMSVTQADVEKLLETYRFNPPPKEMAREIVFANKVISYLKKFDQNRLSDERRSAMEAIASKKVLQLKSAISDYRNAWRNLVDTYESISLGQKPSHMPSGDG